MSQIFILSPRITRKEPINHETPKTVRRKKRLLEKQALEEKYNKGLMAYRSVTDLDFSSSSDVSEEEDEDFNLVQHGKEVVMKTFTPIYKTYVDYNRKYFMNGFRKHVKQYMPRRYRTFNFSPTFPDPLIPHRLEKDDFVCMPISSQGDMYPCFVQGFSSSPMLPRESFYIPTDRNVTTEDRLRLPNFPYLEDLDVTEKLCLDLRNLYPYGAHGEHRGWGLPITDELLYTLLEKCLKIWEPYPFNIKYLYKAIYKLFPNKLIISELENVFPLLEKRFEFRDHKKLIPQHPTMDDSDAIGPGAFNDSALLRSDFPEIDHFYNIPLSTVDENKEDNKLQACGPDCFKMEEAYDERQTQLNCISICKAVLEPFTGEAETMFEMFLRMARYTPCRVSEIMRYFYPKQYRTCREILIMTKDRIRNEDIVLHDFPKRQKTTWSSLGLAIVLEKKKKSKAWSEHEEHLEKFKVEVSKGQYRCLSRKRMRRGQFIGNYTGEIISDAEASRRRRVYEEFNQNFMLKLNKSYWIDATRTGNVLRFAKHSKRSNCYQEPIFENGEWTVGIYAKNGIARGDEISINRQ